MKVDSESLRDFLDKYEHEGMTEEKLAVSLGVTEGSLLPWLEGADIPEDVANRFRRLENSWILAMDGKYNASLFIGAPKHRKIRTSDHRENRYETMRGSGHG